MRDLKQRLLEIPTLRGRRLCLLLSAAFNLQVVFIIHEIAVCFG